MRFTDRLNLKLPEPQDSYNIQDFTDNFQQIVDSLAGIPTITNYLTLEEFINSGTADDLKHGDTVAINNLIYILVGSDPLNASHYMVYGAEALVIMREYVPITERIKGSMYLQLGKTRRLIIRVFKKFLNNLIDTNDTQGFVRCTGAYKNRSVTFVRSESQNVSYYIKDFTNLEVGKTYTLSAKCETDDSLKGFIQAHYTLDNGDGTLTFEPIKNVVGTDIVLTITPTKESKKIRFQFGLYNSSAEIGTTITFSEMCLEESSTAIKSDADTLHFQKASTKTTNISDGNKYRFTCKNLSILAQGENPERLDGKIYFVADTEE